MQTMQIMETVSRFSIKSNTFKETGMVTGSDGFHWAKSGYLACISGSQATRIRRRRSLASAAAEANPTTEWSSSTTKHSSGDRVMNGPKYLHARE